MSIAWQARIPGTRGPLADLTSGAPWTTAGVVGTLALLLPGAERDHLAWALGVAALATAWGLGRSSSGTGG